MARLYIRRKDLGGMGTKDRPGFATTLVMAVDLVRWAHGWLKVWGPTVWVVADGAYAKAPVLKALLALGVTKVSRLRKDAALFSVPELEPKRRGPRRVYGKHRVSLAKRAGQKGGWTTGTFTLYEKPVQETYKTFEATWRPAGGTIRVVLVEPVMNLAMPKRLAFQPIDARPRIGNDPWVGEPSDGTAKTRENREVP